MSEYTPTTEEVRERFVDGFPMDTWAVSRAACGEEFDRWLADHDAAGGAQLARKAVLAEVRAGIEDLPGSDATGYYASTVESGYREAQLAALAVLDRAASETGEKRG